MPEGYIVAAAVADVPPGTLLGVEVAGHRICLANVDGEIYALQDNCSHEDFPLSAGDLEDDELTCAWHGARFDVTSGRALCLPAIRPVRTFDVKVQGDTIYIAP